MPTLLNEKIQAQLHGVFKDLQNPVQVLFFSRKEGCEYCGETQQLLEEVTALSDRFFLSIIDMDADPGMVEQYRIARAPAIVVAAREAEAVIDYGIRFYGIPSGHEFTTLVNDLVMVSSRSSGLSKETAEFLKGVKSPLLLQVFTTPT
ncbi:MAG TPA: hypothetical protein VF813_11835 [Anaerolineaceae bacterium]